MTDANCGKIMQCNCCCSAGWRMYDPGDIGIIIDRIARRTVDNKYLILIKSNLEEFSEDNFDIIECNDTL